MKIPESLREKILQHYEFCCIYCGGYATSVDHIIPYSYVETHDPENLVAACMECNLIAGDKVFESLEKKTEYIREVRKRPKWRTRILKRVAICTDCKTPFKPRSKNSTVFLCRRCTMIANLPIEERPARRVY